jgi:pantetheine-phosphate adenylyltransferase
MAKAVYPGSFDPITLGHLDIIRRIQKIFGGVTLLIANNPSKKYLFTAEERKALIEEVSKGIPGVTVDIHHGLTVDYLREKGATVIIRGLRAVNDFEYEFVMANMNKKLAPHIETMIVFASPEFYYVSSNTVKEVALNGGVVKELVPPAVDRALKAKYAEKKASEKQASEKQTTGAGSSAARAVLTSNRSARTTTRPKTRRRTK